MKNLFTLLCLLSYCLSYTQNQDTYLSLNTEMHTAYIDRIASDAAGKYVLTCSSDKSAKLWDSRTGRLLQTYRPPRGKGNEGMLYAGAISPNGDLVAVGGYSGFYEKNRSHDIYLFNRQTGELIARIPGLANVIIDLEFSPNGRYLVAALGGGAGIRVYHSSNYQEVYRDREYGAASYNIAFAPNGRLATVCYDGYIRLYDSDFSLLKKVKTKGGSQPFSLAFSPDGRKLAIGYRDSPKLEVLDANSLQGLYKPDITGASTVNDRFYTVSFSKDGKQLIAGGFYSKYKNGKYWRQIRIWEQAGKGSYQDYNACNDSVMDIKVLSNGNILYCGASPDWGILDKNTGQQLVYKAKELNSYASKNRSHFKISRAGYEIGVTPHDKAALSFDVNSRSLSKTASNMPSYKASTTNLEVSDWKNTYSPKLNGKALSFLEEYETCRSVDIANDAQSLVFGANYGIYKLAATGKKLWNTPTQATAWAVNIAANNKVVAVALGNGQIRWYRMSDGEELLSLYIHPDMERWVLWTPSGYYDASPGAEDLIGWHLNQGEDKEGLFYPIDRFRDTYYRPDVIDLILEELDEQKALERANKATNKRTVYRSVAENLPPNVRILSPVAGTSVAQNSITLRYNVKSPNKEEITGVRILVNNRPIGATRRGLKPSGITEEVTVNIPSQDCTISVIAENKHGKSEATTIYLEWSGGITQDLLKPTMYVLAVGISDYQNMSKENDLDYAHQDAQDFAQVLKRQKGGMYRDVVVKVLTESSANKNDILDGLDWIVKETTSKDIAVLFFAGHAVHNNSGTLYFLPHQADIDTLRRTGLMQADIQDAIASIPGKVLTFMDACHSGSLMTDVRRGGEIDINRILNEFSSAEVGSITYSSSTARQYSIEHSKWQNGAFTEALVEGLRGKAAYPDGRITCKSLDAYISNRVKELTNGKQAPTTAIPHNTPDFPIAIKRD